jgi:hypothetical protein
MERYLYDAVLWILKLLDPSFDLGVNDGRALLPERFVDAHIGEFAFLVPDAAIEARLVPICPDIPVLFRGEKLPFHFPPQVWERFRLTLRQSGEPAMTEAAAPSSTRLTSSERADQ